MDTHNTLTTADEIELLLFEIEVKQKRLVELGVSLAEPRATLFAVSLPSVEDAASIVDATQARIEPQPKWHEAPSQAPDGSWCGRYQYQKMGRVYKERWAMDSNGEPIQVQSEDFDVDVDVDVDVVAPPSWEVEPKQIDGVWYWVPRAEATSNS